MTPQHRLPARALTLAVGFKMLDLAGRRTSTMTIDALLEALPREDADDVTRAYKKLMNACWLDGEATEGRHGLRAERMRELRQPLSQCKRSGLTVQDLADRAGVERHAMACALVHSGYLELAPYGGKQSRRLVTRTAEAAGYGHNVDGSQSRIGRLEGFNRSCPFPVFYEEHLDDILWSLDIEGIREKAVGTASKRGRLSWLLEVHGYFPNDFVALLSGCSLSGVKKARGRLESKVTSQVREGDAHETG